MGKVDKLGKKIVLFQQQEIRREWDEINKKLVTYCHQLKATFTSYQLTTESSQLVSDTNQLRLGAI